VPEFLTAYLTGPALAAFAQVIMIDLVLAGDNAIVIGLAAAGLPAEQRSRAILIGILAATALRILFAAFTIQLLQVVGLLLAGGILLLWVCWKMWRELQNGSYDDADGDGIPDGNCAERKTLAQATRQIVVADVSMSLDNVLAVAGAARDHPAALVFGLALSIVLMGVCATFVARLLQKHRWLGYVGLAIVLYIALEMVYRGGDELFPAMVPGGRITG
jgi:YjbE family integral membrane protein